MNLQDKIIADFLDACFDAGIKRPEAFILSKMPQVYGWLKGAFPRGILPTDVDGEVEINGHFLRLEFKHESALRNGRIPRGQHAALKSLIATRRFTVALVGTDDAGQPVCFEIWKPNGKVTELVDCTRDDFVRFCEKWSKYASSRKAP